MPWTGIATDLTLDDVIGPPRDSAPASPPTAALRETVQVRRDTVREATPNVTPRAGVAQPQPYQPRPLSDVGAPARPRPHVSVTEDMLPPRKSQRGYWLLGAMVLAIAGLVVSPFSRHDTPAADAPAPAATADSAVDLTPPVADEATEVPAEWSAAPPKKALLTRAAKKHKPGSRDVGHVDHVESHDTPEAAEPAGGAGDMSLEKFRQLSGKI